MLESATLGLLRHLSDIHLSWSEVFWTFVQLVLLYILFRVVYRLYFHPLAKFPGPKWAAITPVYDSIFSYSGYYYLYIERLHKEYGPVVRTGPNTLSFSTTTALRTIFDHKQTYIKAPAYRPHGSPATLVSESDPVEHSRKRKRVQNAFSLQALTAQEGMVTHWIDLLIQRLGEYGDNGKTPINAVRWYNMALFDIIGELAFGESFGSLEKGKQHKWIDVIFLKIKSSHHIHILNHFPWIASLFLSLNIFSLLVPKHLMEAMIKVGQYSTDKIKERMASETPKKDFMSYILANKDDPSIHDVNYLALEASLFATAGSETTVSFLSGVTWLLCKHPDVYKTLTSEIRNEFSSYDEITFERASHLRYLNAVIEEGLRYFPPVILNLPRVSPGGVIDGYYVPSGTIVGASFRALTRSEKYWTRPNEFCPQRWLPKDHPLYSTEFDNDNRQASQPFSVGPRACIGRNLAYMEMRLVLSKMLWKYDLRLGDRKEDQKWLEDGTMKLYAMWEKPEMLVSFIPIR